MSGLNRNLKAGSHDALVLVHPTYAKVKRPCQYPYKILDSVTEAKALGIPVFVVPFNGLNTWLDSKLAVRGLIEVPNYLHRTKGVKRRVLRKRLQREVDFIATKLAMPPAEIRLGFGGMYAAACVFYIAQTWCRCSNPRWPDWEEPEYRSWRPRRPIGYGEILEELVVGFDDYEYVIDNRPCHDPFLCTGGTKSGCRSS